MRVVQQARQREWGIWKEQLKSKEYLDGANKHGGNEWFCPEREQSDEVLMYGPSGEMKSEHIEEAGTREGRGVLEISSREPRHWLKRSQSPTSPT